MHGVPGRGKPDAPGLTALTGQFRRPATAWVCRSTVDSAINIAIDHDISGPLWVCRRADVVLKEAKTIYYLGKALSLLSGL